MGKPAYDIMQFPHDSNLTITLLRVLVDLWSSGNPKSSVASVKTRISIFFSSSSEKAIPKGMPKAATYYSTTQIKVNFLPVGHTHEDVDQLFSKVSTYLKMNLR